MEYNCHIEKAFPKYSDVGEAEVVDLSPDGIPFIPVLGEAHYTKVSPDACDLHIHPEMIEILLCRRGRGISIDCDSRLYPFPPGTVMVIQPGVPHVLRPKPKNLLTSWIWFKMPKRGESIPRLTARETRWIVARLSSMPITFPATKDLIQSFRRLWHLQHEVPTNACERKLVIREAVMRLLMDVFDSSGKYHRENDDSRLVALVTEMREDCVRDWPLDELASRAAMSIPVLTESVRRLTGLPPHQFLVSCRLEKTKSLLASTDWNIGLIANEVGIATAQHLATLFKRETGMSPLVWRAKHRKA